MGSLAELEARGVTVTKDVGEDGVARVEARLPKASALAVRFGPEGIGSAIRKWIKSEVQTGDDAFDQTVYVDSSNEHALLGELLGDAEVRGGILLSIVGGGAVEVDGDLVTWEGPEGDDIEPALVALTRFALEH